MKTLKYKDKEGNYQELYKVYKEESTIEPKYVKLTLSNGASGEYIVPLYNGIYSKLDSGVDMAEEFYNILPITVSSTSDDLEGESEWMYYPEINLQKGDFKVDSIQELEHPHFYLQYTDSPMFGLINPGWVLHYDEDSNVFGPCVIEIKDTELQEKLKKTHTIKFEKA